MLLAGGLLGLLTLVLYWAAFPAWSVPEAAYVFAVPLLLWLLIARPGRLVLFVLIQSVSILGWLGLLVWLRHVTVFGWIVLSVVLAQFLVAWFYLARLSLSRVLLKGVGMRLMCVFALAGAWCVLEWVRSWVFSGFPWLPLAASQWERPVVLQVIAWTGSYGLSFILVFFNLALALYGARWWTLRKLGRPMQRSLELYVAVGFLLGCVLLFFVTVRDQGGQRERVFRVGVVQPNVPARLKWVREEAQTNWETLERLSSLIARMNVDVILWPESATPLPVKGPYPMQAWVEALSDSLEVPILMGNMAREGSVWYNGLFFVDPFSGLDESYYIKRKLVPFGEYVPFRSWLPGVDKLVPVGDDFVPGGEVTLLSVLLAESEVWVGGLVCYEDVFSGLARESVQAGAECLVVVTNDAWYGEEAAAYQHAAHSVLRAVEVRRPVIRCGNGGWSGWVDACGRIRQVLVDEAGSVYFRGAEVLDVFLPYAATLGESLYVRLGDYFVFLCACFCLFFWPVSRLS